MEALNVGMNDLYRLTHSSLASASEVDAFRKKIVDLDKAVVAAYGWEDLDLDHGFHEVPYLPENDRVRFTISEPARIEVLRRLLALNRRRYEEEASQGQRGVTSTRSTARAPERRRTTSADSAQPAFDFDEDSLATPHTKEPAVTVLNFLASRSGWHAKAEILAATDIPDGQWNSVINDLIASGNVERQGEKRGARYRAVTEEAKE